MKNWVKLKLSTMYGKFGQVTPSFSKLDELSKIPRFDRKRWPIDNEPVHLSKDDYFESFDDYSGEPLWEESDKSYRDRILNHLPTNQNE